MGGTFIIFIILGILLLAQSVKSLRDGFRYLDYVRRCRAQAPGDYAPPVAVILPVTGADASLETNIAAFMAQDYPQYQLVLVVCDERDPAFTTLSPLVKKSAGQGSDGRCNPSLVVAGPSNARGQKVHNLLRGLDEARDRDRKFWFLPMPTPGRA